MKKTSKFIGLIMALVLGCSTLTGCFVEYDREKDFMQEAAKIQSYEITNPTDKNDTYTTEEFTLYKWQVANFVNQYYQYLEYYTIEELLKDALLTQRVIINAAHAYKDFGLVRWSQYEEDSVTDMKFDTLDDYIEEQIANIYADRGEDYVPETEEETEEESTSTTYPVYEDDSRAGFNALSVDQLINECVERGILVRDNTEETSNSAYKSEYSKYALIKLITDDLKSSGYYKSVSDEELRAEVVAKCDVSATDAAAMSRYNLIGKLDDYYYSIQQSRSYKLDKTRIPGVAGSDAQLSLETAAVERTITYLKETLDDALNVSAEDQAKIDAAWKDVEKAKKEKGISGVYETLGKGYIMEYLVGESYREQILIQLLQEYIESTVMVSDDEIKDRYAQILADQKSKFADNETAYEEAMSANETIVYHPEINGYYVKHILIPFSTEQSAELSAYDGSGKYAKYNNKTEYRDYLATQIVGYEHIDGEDAAVGKDIDEIRREINKVVTEASAKNKDKEFSKLIYKYSTDTGSITLRYGYKEVITGESSYMPEFAEAARDLYDAGVVGATQECVTDYGVHILMLVRTNDAEHIVGLDEYASASDNLTVRDYIEDELFQDRYSKIYTKWIVNNITNAYNDNVEIYSKVFENIIEEMTEE